MKNLFFLFSAVITLSTAVNPAWAQESSEVRIANPAEESGPSTFTDLNATVNPQLGMSSFEYSKKTGSGGQGMAGGATVELGSASRKLETGVLILQTGGDVTLNNGQDVRLKNTYLALPMMAKLRIMSMRSQSWFVKFGMTTALRIKKDDQNLSNAADVLAGLGLAGRFPLAQKSDFIIEATYNRGLLEAVRTKAEASFNQGFIVLAGVSIKI